LNRQTYETLHSQRVLAALKCAKLEVAHGTENREYLQALTVYERLKEETDKMRTERKS